MSNIKWGFGGNTPYRSRGSTLCRGLGAMPLAGSRGKTLGGVELKRRISSSEMGEE